ncbi:MAG: radical SAM protein [Candidatus Omnitrophica bacterium]|nr:radical SAM protein [Candidatus Omnitrophota bacterium]MDD5553336.1 radical SAM protein [Candidatus Omnitrophota bacterium]
MAGRLFNGFSRKTCLFYAELKGGLSYKRMKRLFLNPGIIFRYMKAFFVHKMTLDPAIFKEEQIAVNGSRNFYIFGDFEELHDRITGVKDSFAKEIKEIKLRISSEENIKITIGISRYNFLRVNRMAEFCMSLLGSRTDLSSIRLDLFPVKDISKNFSRFLDEIKKNIDTGRISVAVHDDKLAEILDTVGLHAHVNPGREKDLLRLLGIICEQVFIGPQTIVFDPFHRCNAKCQHCWVHTPSVKHPEEFLSRKFDLEIFKKIIDDAAEMLTDGIILQGDGEPLMYDKFMPMLRYARDKGLGVLFFTNGILLNEDRAKEVIQLGVNEIYCSFPAGTAEVYEKVASVQPAQTFYTIRDNLKRFMVLRRKAGKDKPRLIVTHVIHNMNYHQLIEMAKMDVEIAPDAVRFYLIRLDVMNRFLQLKPQEVEEIKRQVPEISDILKKNNIDFVDNFEFQLNHYDEKTGAWSKDFFLNHGCTIGWYFNLIPAKYDMSFCCHLRTVGYLDKQPFKTVWNSIEYWRWRRQAKYLRDNRNVKFANGQVLYDEHCDHCDNHQTIIRTLGDLKKYDLYKYYK